MPMKPARRCSYVGCGRPAAIGGRCKEHEAVPWNAGTVQRLRGRALQRARDELFEEAPLCALCELEGRITLATIRDHRVPLAEGGTEDRSNIQPLCGTCSDIKTESEAKRGRLRNAI